MRTKTTFFGAIALAVAIAAVAAATETPWTGWATGTSKAYDEQVDHESQYPYYTVYDNFNGWGGGQLGNFKAVGSHSLTPDLELFGQATLTCTDGATLFVAYEGSYVIGEDPEFPYLFTAVMTAKGGTGRLVNATGTAQMSGALAGMHGNFYFDFAGTLNSQGNLHEFGIISLDSLNCGKGMPVYYTMEGWNPITGLNTGTGSILPTSDPVMNDVEVEGKTICTFTAEQGPNPYHNDEALHVIATEEGLIFSKFTAQCRIEIDHDNNGVTRMWFDGFFTIVGGTDRYEDASGSWQTMFVTEPSFGDGAWAGYLANGTLLVDQLTTDSMANLVLQNKGE